MKQIYRPLSPDFHAVTGSVELHFTSSRSNCIILKIFILFFLFSMWHIPLDWGGGHNHSQFPILCCFNFFFFNFRYAYQSLFLHPFTQDRHACLSLLFFVLLTFNNTMSFTIYKTSFILMDPKNVNSLFLHITISTTLLYIFNTTSGPINFHSMVCLASLCRITSLLPELSSSNVEKWSIIHSLKQDPYYIIC